MDLLLGLLMLLVCLSEATAQRVGAIKRNAYYDFGSYSRQTVSLEGTKMKCDIEGEIVTLPNLDTGCFKCVCKNGYVDCGICPKIDDCYFIIEDGGCCKKCKGCIYKGEYHHSHTEWNDPDEPCKTLHCEAGVVTESNTICHMPCVNPLPPEPGKCCPTCPECKINGQIASEDREVISDDPCLKCSCANGRMTCAKKACPVLQCPVANQYVPDKECCPKCRGTRMMLRIESSCTIQRSFFREGHSFNIDRCTNCTCVNETSVCTRDACPILECPPDMQKPIPGSCCKQCIFEFEEVRSQCMNDGKVYEEGDSWKLNDCSSCKCHQGKASCARTKCTTSNCPPGTKEKKVKGECCPRCEEDDGVCRVFGDPHYKTFDGKFYSFKASGKYQLVADCKNRSFYVRVANAKQYLSARTKRVAIRFGDIRINLQHRNRIKVNGELIRLPFKKDGKIKISKNKDIEGVEVILENGVKLLWNGRSFLEVSVPSSYKNKLCGLCGNFNGNVLDDMETRQNKIVNDTSVFAASWCVGKKNECVRIRPTKSCNKHRMTKSKCNSLSNSQIFEACESKLNFNNYHKACMWDTCNCREEKCHCESFMAYARECERLGAKVPVNWKTKASCDAKRSLDYRKVIVSNTFFPFNGTINRKFNRTRRPIPLH
ncbi:BMP-binding endothelial regulator protein isoform X3 [Aethina tumida]|nr:BMP-binding endothelial regulator protein isoform X3 [Aethina tumida]